MGWRIEQNLDIDVVAQGAILQHVVVLVLDLYLHLFPQLRQFQQRKAGLLAFLDHNALLVAVDGADGHLPVQSLVMRLIQVLSVQTVTVLMVHTRYEKHVVGKTHHHSVLNRLADLDHTNHLEPLHVHHTQQPILARTHSHPQIVADSYSVHLFRVHHQLAFEDQLTARMCIRSIYIGRAIVR